MNRNQWNSGTIGRARSACYGLVVGWLALTPVFAQFYKAGDVVEDFTLANRLASQPIRLSDYAGKIIFLEWFAWW